MNTVKQAKKPTFLITGGAKRLGAAMANFLASSIPCNFVIHYHASQRDAKTLKEELAQHGSTCVLWQADFSSPQKVSNPFLEHDVDILINNAAVFFNDTAENFIPEQMQLAMDVNFRIPIQLTQWLYQACQARNKRAKVVNILDYALNSAKDNFFSYLSSKKALAASQTLQAKAYGDHLSINSIAPGVVLLKENTPQTYIKHMENAGGVLGNSGSVEGVLQTLLYLCQIDCITNQVIQVDGGLHLVDKSNL
jgi:NAD(P)-dependent dehydrogenase (short-subunit alcohol dehydrogenase family)